MRFEARDLKPYAEPVSEADLVDGEAYFSVTFADEAMLKPIIETVVFVGKDKGYLQFEDIESRSEFTRTGKAAGRQLFRCKPDGLNNIFEYDKALDVLLRCALRRGERRSSG